MDYFFKYIKLNNTFYTIKQEKNAQNSKFFKYVKNIQFCIFIQISSFILYRIS